jgi:hypothetical protein
MFVSLHAKTQNRERKKNELRFLFGNTTIQSVAKKKIYYIHGEVRDQFSSNYSHQLFSSS